jgi:hypothetical protein
MANGESGSHVENKLNYWLIRALIVVLIGGGGAGIGGALGSTATISNERQRIDDHMAHDTQVTSEIRTDVKRIELEVVDVKTSNAKLEGQVLARLTAIETALTEIRAELSRSRRSYTSTPQGSQ